MSEITDPILGIDHDGETVLGRSQTSVALQALIPQESEHGFPAFANAVFPLRIRVKVDDGIEVRVLDPFGSPLLEWRFECINLDA